MHLFNDGLLSTYYVPASILHAGILGGTRQTNFQPYRAHALSMRDRNKQVNNMRKVVKSSMTQTNGDVREREWLKTALAQVVRESLSKDLNLAKTQG